MRFLFFQEIAAGPTSKSGQREPFGGRNMLFLLLFFPESQGREPDSCFVHCKAARNGVEMWLALAAICLLRRKDLALVGSGTLENKPVVRSPQLTGEANGCFYTRC
jgi:hypothetical protein